MSDTSPTELRVRLARADDARVIAEFNRAMARETEDLKLVSRTVNDGVMAVLTDPARGFYVVGERAGRVIGMLLVTYEWSDWRNGEFWWIQSVYVVPQDRGRGIYRALYDFARSRGRERGGVCGFRLYVDRNNRLAQGVYEALGMSPSGYLLYEQEA